MSRGLSHQVQHCASLRRRVTPVFLVALLLASTVIEPAGWTRSGASAQDDIRQVVGKELTAGRRRGIFSNSGSGSSSSSRSSSSNGLLGGLFGGGSSRGSSSSRSSSSSSDDEYRKVTPVPRDQPADWAGIPTHGTSDRVTTNPSAPIRDNRGRALRDPGAGSSSIARQSPVPQPGAIGSGTSPSFPSSLPRPPAMGAFSQPTKISSSDSSPGLSRTESSRRSTGEMVITPVPTKPSVSLRREPTSFGDDVVELVPKVSRKIINVESVPPSSLGGTSDAARLSENSSSRRAVPAAKPPVTPPATKPTPPVATPAKVAAKPTPAPTPEVVATTPSMSVPSAKASPADEAAPTPPARTPIVSTPKRAPMAITQTGPQPISSVPGASMRAPTPTSTPPVPSFMMPPASTATTAIGNNGNVAGNAANTLGDARQTQPMVASLGSPQANVSAPAQPVDSFDAATNKLARMNTFGGNRPDSRASGSLATTDNSVALRPISDRLPIEPAPGGSPGDVWHDSMGVSHDSFAARQPEPPTSAPATSAPTNARTGLPVPANTVGYPNQMRGIGNAVPAISVAGTPTPTPATAMDNMAGSSRAASELPGIRIVTAGPRNIMIRQTHAYEIRAENRGSIDAEGLVVRAHIPDWADVVGQQVSAGEVNAATEGSTRNLVWKIARLGAGETQRMFVRLKAARSGTHDLDVDWTLAPQTDRVQVHVQEPELALTIDGPDEVIFGQSKSYKIRVLNPGDGIAPNVVFTLSPNSSTPQSQRIGDIPAGKEAQFEVELTAQDLGELKIEGLATGDLDLKAIANKTVRVLAADLEAILTGPEIKYQNTDAVYQLELTNNGTAASDDVMATLNLPMGVRYKGGMEGASVTDNQLRWKIASLTPGARRNYQFNVLMESTGKQEFAFDCKGSAAGQTAVALTTNVEAIADLVLSIEDPAAPAPVGTDVTYQIVIRNRGSKPATDVRAIAQFSHGIEPIEIRGHAGNVITGQVLIEPIARIDAGQEVRMTIVARAEEGGHHRFRTEIRSGDTVLVAEEATHYMNARNERITRRSGPGGNEFSLPLR